MLDVGCWMLDVRCQMLDVREGGVSLGDGIPTTTFDLRPPSFGSN